MSKQMTTSEAARYWDILKEQYPENKDVKMIRDSWQDGYTVQFSNKEMKVIRTVSFEVASFIGLFLESPLPD